MKKKNTHGGSRPNSGWRNREKKTDTISVSLEKEVLNSLDSHIGKRERSKFINDATKEKLENLKTN